MSNSDSQMSSSTSKHTISTTLQKSNDTNDDTTKVFKLPPIIHTGNSSTTTTDINDNKNGRRSLRKKIVPPKRYAKSPVNTIDVKIGSSTTNDSVQPTITVPPPPTDTTAAQSDNTTDSPLNNTKKKRASPRKIKVPIRFIQDGSPTINNLSALSSTTESTTMDSSTNPQQPTDVDKGASNIAAGGKSSSAAAVPTKRTSSRKITIPAKFTNEEAKLIFETCHSISNKEPNLQDQGEVEQQGVKPKPEAVIAHGNRMASLPPVIHNNNNLINSSTTNTTSIISGGAAQQQQQDEKPKRGQAGRDALKVKRASATAAALATEEDGTTPSLSAKKKQPNKKKEASTKEVTAKKRSSRRKVAPPSSDSKSSSSYKSTNSKTVSKASSITGKRTPAQLKYDTNRPIQSKWLNYYTLLQSYKLKYSSTIVINSYNSNSTKVGIDLNSLGKGTNSKSGKYRQAKKEEEVVGK